MIKRIPILLFTGLFFAFTVTAQSSANTLDIVSWNMEWFGSASNGPADKNLQESNASKIIQWLNADLYGLVEIVDTMRLRKVVDFIGADEYDFVVSPFCSMATLPTGSNWLNGQKLAFIYRKSVFSNVTIRTDITTVVPDYVTAHTVSDHYPVFSKYNLSVLTAVTDVNTEPFSIHVYPNPFTESITIQSFKTTNNVSVRLLNVYGQVLYQQFIGVMQSGSSVRLHIPVLPKGIYLLQVDSKQTHSVLKLTHQ